MTAAQSPGRLAEVVAGLVVGQRVRVNLRHRVKPAVGTLRRAQFTDPDGPALMLDVPGGHIVRDWGGDPGWSILNVDILPDACEPLDPDRLDELTRTLRDAVDNLAAATTGANGTGDTHALQQAVGAASDAVRAYAAGGA